LNQRILYRNRFIDYVRSRTDGFSETSLFSPFVGTGIMGNPGYKEGKAKMKQIEKFLIIILILYLVSIAGSFFSNALLIRLHGPGEYAVHTVNSIRA
jgi:hypothetical protein